ncbi:MAG: hypothetical protein JW720_10235 [Sedimentisphaerales bacterium]|nr:hypothetical protein [Sedimentisphaerales bacterium]
MAQQAGTYFGVLVEAGLDKNQNETPFMYLTFSVTHFNDDGWVELPQPLRRDVRFYLSDAAWPYTSEDLQNLGFNGDWDNPKFKDDLYDPGTELICTVRRGDDNKTYNDWDLPNRSYGSGKERTPPSREEVRKFKARWDTQTAANKQPTGRPLAPPPPSRAATAAHGVPDSDDDIPF